VAQLGLVRPRIILRRQAQREIMNEHNKTKPQLEQELFELQRRNAELEKYISGFQTEQLETKRKIFAVEKELKTFDALGD